MEKDRGAKIIVAIALVVAIVGLTIGYAAYSATLKITGTANVDPAKWDVHFANKSGDSLTGTIEGNAVETTAPTLTATNISGFDVTLKAPGDTVTYNFLVKNTGTIDAILTSFSMGGITCAPTEKSSTTQEDADKLCGELSYSLKYADGSAITTGATLAAGGTSDLVLKIEWLKSSSFLVAGDVLVNIGTSTFVYEQA